MVPLETSSLDLVYLVSPDGGDKCVVYYTGWNEMD